MQIHPIIAENWKMDGGAAFGVVPQTIWKKLITPDENNMIPITTRCLLVEENNRKILFDTGMGNKQADKYYSFRYIFGGHDIENSLAEIGLTKHDITDLVFTHLHDDHCGAAVFLNNSGEPELFFKNAMHHVSRAHWEWANNPNSREIGTFFKVNFKPLETANKLNLIEHPGRFTENIELFQVNGHTHGQMIPKIRFKDKTFVFMADFIPMLANIPLPFIPSVDIQPLETLKEKEAFFDEAIKNNYYLIFQHDLQNECCNLVVTEKGVRAGDIYALNEILS